MNQHLERLLAHQCPHCGEGMESESDGRGGYWCMCSACTFTVPHVDLLAIRDRYARASEHADYVVRRGTPPDFSEDVREAGREATP